MFPPNVIVMNGGWQEDEEFNSSKGQKYQVVVDYCVAVAVGVCEFILSNPSW